ncbi:MAG: hypothetical protein PHI66_01210 [Candidatus Pacebacteria bacterium]|nr:hypothetical protein [Candidatus Paceibacterota bacterium]
MDTELKLPTGVMLGDSVRLSPKKINELKERDAYKNLSCIEDGEPIIEGTLKKEFDDGFVIEFPKSKLLFVRKGDFEKIQ